MASKPSQARIIGAVLLVVVAFALAMRLSFKHPTREDIDAPASVTSVEVSPAESARATPPSRAGHYVSALLPKDTKILGVSSSAGTAVAVGEHGAVFRFRLDDAVWKADTAVTTKTLRSVAQQLDRAVAVGDDGTILELDGGAWSLAPSGTTRTLRAVAYSSYGVVAVGDGGTIVSQIGEGQPWRVETSPTTNDLRGACAGLRDLWVVGASGTMLLRGLEGWRMQATTTQNALNGVGCDDHSAVAVGEKGTALERLDDVGWHDAVTGTTADLFAVSAPISSHSYTIVGDHGTVLHLSSDVMAEPTSVPWSLRAVNEGALGTWIGGDEGLLRRTPQ